MKRKKKQGLSEHKVNLIAGAFRHRAIGFIDADGLRPTATRIRETLFNWLRNDICGARCLDLFAGSGALGFEALSRGASHVTFVDSNRDVCRQIQANGDALGVDMATRVTILHADYTHALRGDFDIVFLDPPYALRRLPKVLSQLACPVVKFVYLEDEQPLAPWVDEVQGYQMLKSKKAGGVYYGLLAPNQA